MVTPRSALIGLAAVCFIACEQRVQLVGDVCDATTCNGCCTVQGCVPFAAQADGVCGAAGDTCRACGVGTACVSGTCRVITSGGCTNCAGCCDGERCILVSQQDNARCGTGGSSCVACNGANVCSGGRCQTSSATCGNCNGCCRGSFGCQSGSSNLFACGRGGAECVSCGAGEKCINGNCEKCGPTNCTGCCSLGDCIPGDDDNHCGHGGFDCKVCFLSETCTAGVCK